MYVILSHRAMANLMFNGIIFITATVIITMDTACSVCKCFLHTGADF
jgi:hypothetical protein